MPLARGFSRLIRRYMRQAPSPDETRVFTALAADATSLGRLLARTESVRVEAEGDVDLADGDEREILGATLRAGAAQHLRAGEDLLNLVERLDRMIELPNGRRDAAPRTALGIALLRGIAVVELLHTESRYRFPSHEPLARLSSDAMHALATGYVRVLGAELPTDMRRAFPHFARAARDAHAPRHTGAGATSRPGQAPHSRAAQHATEPLDAPSAG